MRPLTRTVTAGSPTSVDSASVFNALSVEFHAHMTNNSSNTVVVGDSGITTESGRHLAPGESVAWSFDATVKQGSVAVSKFFVAGSIGSDKVDYSFILED